MAYTALDANRNQIRLLHLAPALPKGDEISCSFTVASLDDEPYYEALSYVWGDPEDVRAVIVDGRPEAITVNLHSALVHLRLEDKERVLWVDALCINQTDPVERMHQVSRMNRIYRLAWQVVVWLGKGWDGSDLAIEFLRILGADETLHLDPLKAPNVNVNGIDFRSTQLCGNLIRLFDLPWWKRVWTVQEFVLGRQLVFQCARNTLPGDLMYMARENFFNHKDGCCLQNELNIPHPDFRPRRLSVESAFCVPAQLDFILKQRGHSYSVLLAMASFCEHQVRDPKDRVYGMLGLGTGEYAHLVDPDYRLSEEQICQAVAIKSAERTGTLEFLSHLFKHEKEKWPSFLPNWTGKYSWSGIYRLRLGSLHFFRASLDKTAQLRLIHPRFMGIHGVIFDKVTSIASFHGFLSSSDDLQELYSLSGVDQASGGFYANTQCSRKVALWHALCGGVETILRDSNRKGKRISVDTDLLKFSKLEAFITAPWQQQTELFDGEMRQVLLDIQSATHGRRFITTDKGYFGFAPEKCKEGDVVVVLAGGQVPYILRPLSPEDRSSKIGENDIEDHLRDLNLLSAQWYTILGDSYVYGIMDGEVFDLLDEKERQLKEIILV